MNCKILIISLLLLLNILPVQAKVVSSDHYGFHIEHGIDVKVQPKQAYQAFLAIGDWWNSEHTWFGSSKNLSLEPKLGGCFCERSVEGQAEHLRVIFLQPNKEVRLSGGLGPLQQIGVQGTLTFKFVATEQGTRIIQSYQVSGFYDQGMQTLAPIVDKVQTSQLLRLADYIKSR